jgi:hypothetical protein
MTIPRHSARLPLSRVKQGNAALLLDLDGLEALPQTVGQGRQVVRS